MDTKRVKFFTSESVTEGHPDKVADQISDAILDAIIEQDPKSRACCETVVTTDLVLVTGEITTKAKVNYEQVVRDTIRRIGYTKPELGFCADTCKIFLALDQQSADINQVVSNSLESHMDGCEQNDQIGAGDQGMVFGFACDETPEFMPLPIMLAHKLTKKLSVVRKSTLPYLYPDGKSQVTVEYHEGRPARVDTVVISAHHNEGITSEAITHDILNQVILPVIPKELMDEKTRILINPAGRFEIGGPKADAGLTGRKIIVDTYGGYCPHGGGAFSGKDPTKVDRSAAYMARYICKNIVAAGLAKKVEMQISYAIGVANPVSIYINTFGTGIISDTKLERVVSEFYDLRPQAIIDKLDLQTSLYRSTSAYGHFGKHHLPWEVLDTYRDLYERVQEKHFCMVSNY